MKYALPIIFVFFIAFLSGCSEKEKNQKPNILWITCEDISPDLSFYGDSTASTPTLDKLAQSGMVYDYAFTTVGVCAPSRSSIITGMYPVSIGTHNMRTGRDYAGWGTRDYSGPSNATDINGDSVPLYSAVIPPHVKCFTEYLREAGYFCTNNQKTDYQFAAPVTAWDQNGPDAHWRNRKPGQPFFSVFNIEVTHESRIWLNKNLPLTVLPAEVSLPPYFPDNPVVRQDVARNYSNIELLDSQIKEKLDELEADGLRENTIVFFFSDHGGPLPRGKREHYDSGLRVPFVVYIPGREGGARIEEMISFVDLAPTMLSLAGMKPLSYMQGQAFLGKFKSVNEREYIYGSGDRFDEHSDMCRTVRDKRFMFVKNFHPELPSYKDVAYRKNIDMMNELLRLHNNGELDSLQEYYFREVKQEEEFYDCEKDPYQLHNLINDTSYGVEIERMRNELQRWREEVDDKGVVPEKQLFNTMWPNGIQPVTESPRIIERNGNLVITCNTPGASIGYIVNCRNTRPGLDGGWKLYTGPIPVIHGKTVYAISNRIGYRDSEIVSEEF
ncbi:MAG: sulfatase-like hydrolase/transferase [Prolixibacteraceae bacterium]|nr:sulfatase-like hydrolase/transferase [Prolixibacteraceae bacterium]